MKKLFLGLTIGLMLIASTDMMAKGAYRYRLFLTDKPADSEVHLSQRALDRRIRQDIPLDEYDRCVSPSYLQALRDAGFVIVTQSRWMNTVVVMRADGRRVQDNEWEQFSFIDRFMRITSSETIKKPHGKPDLATGNPGPTMDRPTLQLIELNAIALLNESPKGEGMLITVVDGGFEGADTLSTLNHHLIGCYDPYMPGDTVYMFDAETSYHGTHCWSIMAADGRTAGFKGSAPMADYYLIRTEMGPSETPLEEDMWINGVERADSIGSDLVSSSLGYYEFDDYSYNYTQSQLGTGVGYCSQAAEIGFSRGMLICNAAGNERQSYWGAIDFPSDAEHVLTVGATDIDLKPGSFTSPGFLTPYVKPEVSCRGVNTYYIKPNGRLGTGNGTSYATPLMCGCCASLWSAAPSLSAAQIRDIVCQSASQYASPDSLIGYGLPDFYQALQVALELAGPDGITSIKSDTPRMPCSETDLMGRVALGKGLRVRNDKVIFVK